LSFSIHIICVNYKNNEQTEKFVKNILAMKKIEQCKIWLINNSALGFKDNSFESLMVIAKNSLQVINAPENLGYFGAARVAFREINKSYYEWVILSNTDMSIKDLSLFENLRKYECPSDVVVLAPSIISSLTVHESNPLMLNRPSKLRMHFYKWIFAIGLLSHVYHLLALIKSKIKSSFSSTPTTPSGVDKQSREFASSSKASMIYAPHGAVMFFHKSYFAAGGNFEHKAFLYCEEFSVAERVRLMNKKILFDPQFQFFHEERGSTGLFYSSQVLKFKKEANKYIADTYFR
jgi:GT2 family glycosyltransferase